MGLYNNIALFFSFEQFLKTPADINCIAEIITLKEEKTYVDKYILKIINCNENLKIENKKFITYLKKDKNYKPGDIIFVKGIAQRAEEARNFYGFNQRNYLKQNKIYGIIDIETSEYIKTKKDYYYILGKIQLSLKNKIINLYDESYENIINKILFGMDGNIEEEITNDFRDAGISHVLAISGLHISYIIVMINFILEKIISSIKFRNFFICIILIFFLLITGSSPSCVRACIMNIIYMISKNLYRKNNIYISILSAFLIIIFFNMYVVYNVGFWLSFLGTIGIILFHRFFYIIFKIKNNIFIHKIFNIILVSVSAQILIWPVVLYYFNTISLTFFISNIFISVLIGPIIILGYFSVIFSYIFLPIAKIIAFLEEILLKLLFYIADICSKIPFSKIYLKGTNEMILIIYYILIIISICFFIKNRVMCFRKIIILKKFFLKQYNLYKSKNKMNLIKKIKLLLNQINVKRKNIYYNKKRYLSSIICIFIIINLMISYYIYNYKYNKFELYFVDVGQGDCCVIKVNGKNIIIDAGEGNSDKYDYGKNVVFQHLLKLGIDKLDYMIFSHMDSDHAGGLIYILDNMEVGEVLIGVQVENSDCLDSLLKIVKEKNIKLTVLESGMKVKISSKCFIDVLWPMKNKLITENVLNNNSLVFKLYYNEFSILFTGDIEKIAEEKMTDIYKERLKCDILKVAHHGSKTSTIQSFLEYANPRMVLIGVGKNNKFGHPSKEILDRLENCGTRIYRTDRDGEISIIINNKKELYLRKVF